VALQGASGVGLGNFEEIGPLDANLQPRNSTWLQKADLIFVVRQRDCLLFCCVILSCVLRAKPSLHVSTTAQDNPVGVGYSYVEDDSLLVTTDWQQATDMATVLKALVNEVPTLQSSPLFLVAESYGGKYAATLGASVARAARAGELNITLGGKTHSTEPRH
jgi:serine carboxypeptidase 1